MGRTSGIRGAVGAPVGRFRARYGSPVSSLCQATMHDGLLGANLRSLTAEKPAEFSIVTSYRPGRLDERPPQYPVPMPPNLPAAVPLLRLQELNQRSPVSKLPCKLFWVHPEGQPPVTFLLKDHPARALQSGDVTTTCDPNTVHRASL